MERRKTELNLLIGVNGSGKTTFLRNILPNYKRAIIITPDSAEWKDLPILTKSEIKSFSGAKRIICPYHQFGEIISFIEKNYSGGLLALDDCKNYLPSSNQTTPELGYLYTRRRQFGADCFMIGHSIDDMPPRAFNHASWLILFSTNSEFVLRKNILVFKKISEAQLRINKEVAKGNPYYHEIILIDTQIRGLYEYGAKNNG
jgi:hypothetical protein